ncbi:hypothetical protein NG895_22005 [Aeoliella sp. ICT_H6.2]|uniref:Sodium/calcium exchanger membrane region domain-containing protein n=1 Tax=Aeoliella straminimaris TaxID=2954799 RepID=A0A9X2FHX7_9BACT|nr:hypothetical protein [Aeoliella straminimaris]MCO6046581.1 hypothetical protein [Aeoliella straminimaris]
MTDSVSPAPEAEFDESTIDRTGLWVTALVLVAMGVCWFAGWTLGWLMSGGALIAIVIWQACDPFAETAQWIGGRLRIPGSVRGATLDAVASSMPELFSGIFFVVLAVSAADPSALSEAGAEGYGATIATCAGSAVYNMILIPAAVALVVSYRRHTQRHVEVENVVLARDGVWFLVCEMLLIVFLYEEQMQWWHALVFLGMYGVYLLMLVRGTYLHRKRLDAEALAREDQEEEEELPTEASCLFGLFNVPIGPVSAWTIIIVTTLVAAGACYFLVETTRQTAGLLGVPTFFVAVILAAAVSSVPDTFLSIGAAMRGDDSGAISNAFGSNIFDICVCLSIPLLVNSYLVGWEPVSMLQDGKPIPGLVGLRLLLWVLTAVTLLVLWHRRQLTRAKALFLIALYLVFVGYAVTGSIWAE